MIKLFYEYLVIRLTAVDVKEDKNGIEVHDGAICLKTVSKQCIGRQKKMLPKM